MDPYKNYPSYTCTPTQEQFNKYITQLQIEIKHGFTIHQNLCI